MRRSLSLLVGAALFAAPAVAGAQTAPAAHTPGGQQHRWPAQARPASAAFAIRLAYDAIGHAEAAGGTGPYLDGARSHYREALALNTKSDVHGAMAQARAASSLARASVALVPKPVPHDIPAPPAAPAQAAGSGGWHGAGGHPGAMGMTGHPPMAGGPGGPGGGWGHRGGRGAHGHGGGIEDLGKLASVANTDEAKRLANDALNANLASERAAFAGNREEAMRQKRLASDLSGAVRALAMVNMKPRQAKTPAPAASQ